MDLSFKTVGGRFNYRVAAVICRDGRLLTIQEPNSSYSYLPGGRVAMKETAEEAILREVFEETGLQAELIRPLWLNQAFFTEDQTKESFHEICLYFLVELLVADTEDFLVMEHGRVNQFKWLAFEELQETYFYPEFLKNEIFQLPNHLTLRVEREKD
ncbi:NUDIX hydrolase [Streptococcus sp. S784/96/1]|uniref:NUDIX hydrolase n=1 Tax=Streptococcus sp. S784/96/1 TaxID=2653499 RepID=UPI0013898025|nr:NUDIX domain-containing protein [Streptococcus sp. S784/96/1]